MSLPKPKLRALEQEPGYALLARHLGFDFAFFVVRQCAYRKDPTLLSAIVSAMELSEAKGMEPGDWYNPQPSEKKRMVLEILGMGLADGDES